MKMCRCIRDRLVGDFFMNENMAQCELKRGKKKYFCALYKRREDCVKAKIIAFDKSELVLMNEKS